MLDARTRRRETIDIFYRRFRKLGSFSARINVITRLRSRTRNARKKKKIPGRIIIVIGYTSCFFFVSSSVILKSHSSLIVFFFSFVSKRPYVVFVHFPTNYSPVVFTCTLAPCALLRAIFHFDHLRCARVCVYPTSLEGYGRVIEKLTIRLLRRRVEITYDIRNVSDQSPSQRQQQRSTAAINSLENVEKKLTKISRRFRVGVITSFRLVCHDRGVPCHRRRWYSTPGACYMRATAEAFANNTTPPVAVVINHRQIFVLRKLRTRIGRVLSVRSSPGETRRARIYVRLLRLL